MVIRQHVLRTAMAVVRAAFFSWLAVLFVSNREPLGEEILLVLCGALMVNGGVRALWAGVVLDGDRMIVRSELGNRVIPLAAIDDVRGDGSVLWHTASGAERTTQLTMFRDWWLSGGHPSAFNQAALMRIAAWVDARDLTPSSALSVADQPTGGRQTSV